MKVSKEKMVLHLPFDEEVGSTLAHNFAPNRTASNDAVLDEGCSFTEDAVFGNALHITNDGECVVSEELVDFTEEFTLSAFIRPTGSKLEFVVNYTVGLQQSFTAQVAPFQWIFVAFQRVLVGNVYYTRCFIDDKMVFYQEYHGICVGCCIIDETNEVTIDDVRLWNRALSLTEIFSLHKEDEYLDFFVDGVNFKDFGVEVSKADGMIDALARKEPLRVDWDSMHGEVIDLSRPHWQAREISLECFLVANSKTDFIRSMNRFFAAFSKAGTQRLTCQYSESVKPLEFDVYRTEKVEVDNTWTDELKVGTFTIAMREPQPVKIIIKHICQSASSEAWFQCHTTKMLTVTWGDNDTSCTIVTGAGNASKSNCLHDSNGNPLKVKHTYTAAGEYNIVIHGNIESITSLTTNCIIIYGANGNIQ